MIYHGPLDGEETDIQEIPIGGFFRHPIPAAMSIQPSDNDTFEPINQEAIYRVTDIGEMTFESYR